jgi:hypothetical protein
MDVKYMTTLESTRISNEIKEQCEKHEKFVRREFFISPLLKTGNKGDEDEKRSRNGNRKSRKRE